MERNGTLGCRTLLIVSLVLVAVMLLATGCRSRSTAREAEEESATVTGKVTAREAPAPSIEREETSCAESVESSPRSSTAPSSDTVGLAVGGAKDVNNFRRNIENGYLPLPTDITYEGLFYDYYFDTGQTEECRELFCPSYACAVTRDPLSGRKDYYLSVGLNSGMKEDYFRRKKLNLVIVLDVSGSMSSEFDEYYYDSSGHRVRADSYEPGTTKMSVAKEAVASLIGHLTGDDRFGLVVFNAGARLIRPLEPIGETGTQALYEHVFRIEAGGSTNLEAGMRRGTEQLQKYADANPTEYENRIIFLTDAMPNTGDIGRYGLLGITGDNADNRIHTTFIGIGVDFNTELVESITKIRGANYYSVHSPQEFRTRMRDEFDYMVTPLVFDLTLTLDAYGWEIESVYGSPQADQSTGEIMRVDTLFPAKKRDGETRGGLILLKLRKLEEDGGLRLRVSYEDRYGLLGSSEATVTMSERDWSFFDTHGIRKGVALARYADLLKNWVIDEREHAHYSRPWKPRVNRECGIIAPPPTTGRWERQSMPLTVSLEYARVFDTFRGYFSEEIGAVGDASLTQELRILDRLSYY